MARHKSFTVDTKVNVYFCDPQSPWQRGTNENTNGLLRQYFPRKTDLSGYSQTDLDKVALRLNQRPRKTLGFDTPASRLQASVASKLPQTPFFGNFGAKFGVFGRQDCSELPTIPTSDWVQAFYAPRSTT